MEEFKKKCEGLLDSEEGEFLIWRWCALMPYEEAEQDSYIEPENFKN